MIYIKKFIKVLHKFMCFFMFYLDIESDHFLLLFEKAVDVLLEVNTFDT